MGNLEVLEAYIDFEKKCKDPYTIIGFSTTNGRRIIITNNDNNRRKCIPINNAFRVVSYKDDLNETFYDSPLECLMSYFEEVEEDIFSAPLISIEFFSYGERSKAYEWLQVEVHE